MATEKGIQKRVTMEKCIDDFSLSVHFDRIAHMPGRPLFVLYSLDYFYFQRFSSCICAFFFEVLF